MVVGIILAGIGISFALTATGNLVVNRISNAINKKKLSNVTSNNADKTQETVEEQIRTETKKAFIQQRATIIERLRKDSKQIDTLIEQKLRKDSKKIDALIEQKLMSMNSSLILDGEEHKYFLVKAIKDGWERRIESYSSKTSKTEDFSTVEDLNKIKVPDLEHFVKTFDIAPIIEKYVLHEIAKEGANKHYSQYGKEIKGSFQEFLKSCPQVRIYGSQLREKLVDETKPADFEIYVRGYFNEIKSYINNANKLSKEEAVKEFLSTKNFEEFKKQLEEEKIEDTKTLEEISQVLEQLNKYAESSKQVTEQMKLDIKKLQSQMSRRLTKAKVTELSAQVATQIVNENAEEQRATKEKILELLKSLPTRELIDSFREKLENLEKVWNSDKTYIDAEIDKKAQLSQQVLREFLKKSIAQRIGKATNEKVREYFKNKPKEEFINCIEEILKEQKLNLDLEDEELIEKLAEEVAKKLTITSKTK